MARWATASDSFLVGRECEEDARCPPTRARLGVPSAALGPRMSRGEVVSAAAPLAAGYLAADPVYSIIRQFIG